MDKLTIRKLAEKDWQIWKEFRLECLKNSPENFGSSWEEEADWSESAFKEDLAKNDIFAVFINDILASGVGFNRLNSIKTKHIGVIWGMYTRPAYRGKGYASLLLAAIISHAKQYISQLNLTCVASNLDAIELYKSKGFRIYGQQPNALKVEDKYLDAYMMTLELN
ncbi:MAG: GNAT family N-acetyltransferase [Rickettsiaceae bacterium]|nr:GNAT family N-acetyltransferase [Rickettsiaceae bacterium]